MDKNNTKGNGKREPDFLLVFPQKTFAFAAIILMILVFSLLSTDFFAPENIRILLLTTSVNGLLALGLTFVILMGGIDLSIGTIMSLASLTAGIGMSQWGLPLWAAVALCILVGALAGLVNGLLISRLKLPAFMVTLGVLNIIHGLSLFISGETSPSFSPEFKNIAEGLWMDKIIPGFPIPNGIFIFFFMAILATLLLNKTVMGRYNFAIGSNSEAARLSGIPVVRWQTAIYCLNGVFCGIAAVVLPSVPNMSQPSLGFDHGIAAIGAVLIGGTSLSGGMGSISGTVIGTFALSVLLYGLRILKIKQEWLAMGILIVLSLIADGVRRKKREER